MSEVKKVPPACRPGDRVMVVAPASPFHPELLEAGCARLRDWGLEPLYPPSILERWGYLAGRDELRMAGLVEAFRDPSIKAVICARGGYGCARLVDHLPWPMLAENPKRFCGFSDVTFLHLAFAQRCDYVTFHGPMVASGLFLEGSTDSVSRLRMALFGQELPELCPPIRAKALQRGKAQGMLLGGNLSLLATSLGTPWQPDFRDVILCLEDIDERPYSLDRLFQHLRMAGVLDQIAGLILGDFGGELTDQYTTYSAEEFWHQRLALPEHCPILYDFPFGHTRDNLTLPLGAQVEIDGDVGLLKVLAS